MKQLFAILLFSAASINGWSQQKPLANKLDQVASAYHRVHGFSGNIYMVQDNETIFENSYGLADRSFGIVNSPQTRFSINSISKTFTALAILQLAEANKLDLHKPINNYLPKFEAPWASSVTTHHLLTHSSGLPRESGVQATDRLNFNEQLQLIAHQELLFNPGERYEYSNSGVIVLGALIEAASGQEYGRYIEEHILRPLDLKDSGYYYGNRVVQNQAIPYRFTASGLEFAQRSKHYGDNAGGGLYSTPKDLYNYVTGLMNHEVLSQTYTKLLFQEHIQSGETDWEAYAWSIKYFGDEKIYFAAGSGYGTKSVIIHMPASNDFIGITSNWGNTPILPLLRDLYLSLRGLEVELPAEDALADPKDYTKHLGTYIFDQQALTDNLGMDVPTMKLQVFEGRLFLDDELLTDRQGVLRLSYTNELSILFEKEQMVVEINGNTMIGTKISQ